jgi:2Fe-2S ferredoxin
MPRVTFVEPNGAEHHVEVANGCSVMEGALNNSIRGIDGDCGGNCACGTCHVHVAAEWRHEAGTQSDMERDMLEFAEGAREDSRLCCQIEMSDALDGLVVYMADGQH